jgi:hypothetical protein
MSQIVAKKTGNFCYRLIVEGTASYEQVMHELPDRKEVERLPASSQRDDLCDMLQVLEGCKQKRKKLRMDVKHRDRDAIIHIFERAKLFGVFSSSYMLAETQLYEMASWYFAEASRQKEVVCFLLEMEEIEREIQDALDILVMLTYYISRSGIRVPFGFFPALWAISDV